MIIPGMHPTIYVSHRFMDNYSFGIAHDMCTYTNVKY